MSKKSEFQEDSKLNMHLELKIGSSSISVLRKFEFGKPDWLFSVFLDSSIPKRDTKYYSLEIHE